MIIVSVAFNSLSSESPEDSGEAMLDGIVGGTTYLVKEPRGQAAFALFTRLTSPDHPGLCITRKHP
ncbi:MAG: hypothetical protein LN410_03815, partial [Candidatus Thermoplasmatota archaeon]|nr:hypothetical protein [Candidatus Thermoplasmatota archaeon]